MLTVRVQILNITVPAQYQDSGGVFLDIGETDLSLSRVAEELNEINLIRYGGVRKFNLPLTGKNQYVFREFFSPTPIDFDYTPLECRIYVGSNTLEETKIGATRINEGQRTFEAVATKATDYWIIGAKALRLPQIPYEDIEFTFDNITLNQATQYAYSDGDIGIHFTPMYFGKPYVERRMTVEYFRWNYHLLRVFTEGFRTFGWCFKCEALESDKGRQILAYLIDPNAYSREELINANKAAAESGEINRDKNYTVSVGGLGPLFGLLGILTSKPTYGYHFVVLHDTVNFDPGSNMQGGRYYGFGRFKFTFTIQYVPKDLRASTIKVQFFRNNPPPPVSKPTLIHEESFTPINDDTGDINQTYEKAIEVEATLQTNQSITVMIYAESRFKSIKIKNTFIEVTPTLVFPQRGETINPASYLRNDTLLEVLKGWVHIMRGKIDVNVGEKTLTLYPNEETDFLEETLEGYYRNTLIDVTPIQVNNSSVVDTPAEQPSRYQLIRFKESTDFAIDLLGLDKLTPLFSKTVDLGEQFPPEYTVYENPYFEPTLNDWVYDLSPEGFEQIPVNLPMLLDHDPKKEDGAISTDIGPRIFFVTEVLGQTWESESGSQTVRLGMEDNKELTWNHAYHRDPFSTDAEQNNLVFQDPLFEIENTLYVVFWRSWLYANQMASTINILALIKGGEYFGWSYRDAYKVDVRGKSIISSLVAIDDFAPRSGISTPATFRPLGISGVVTDTSDEPDPCDTYSYDIEITKVGTTYNFSAATDNPDAGTLEWRYEGSSSWTTATSLANPTGPFYVRYTAGGDCTDTVVKYVDPCGNVPAIQIDFEVDESGNNCVTATIGGILLDAVTGSSLEYDLDGAGSWTAYTPGTEICGAYTSICFRGTIEFDNTCDDYVLDETCFEVPPDADCVENNPLVTIIHDGLDAFRFDIGGSYVSPIGSFHFFYKHNGEADSEAKRWTDFNPIVGTDYLVRLHVFWCDDCPPYCSEWVPVTDPMALRAPMALTSSRDKLGEWDFDKIPEDRKPEIKNLIRKGKRAELAEIHNELKLSEYDYCCGKDFDKAFAWWYHWLTEIENEH